MTSQTVGSDLLEAIHQPILVIHSREDNSVPFGHPNSPRVCQRVIDFLKADSR